MKIKFMITAIAGAFALFSMTASADGHALRVGVEGAYPPFSWKESDGSLKGFDIDMAMEVCERLNKECVLIEQEWDGMIPALLAKKFDTIIASMSITEERKKKIDFTVKYYNTPAKLVAKKGIGFDGTAAGLKGKRLGVQRATTHSMKRFNPGYRTPYFHLCNAAVQINLLVSTTTTETQPTISGIQLSMCPCRIAMLSFGHEQRTCRFTFFVR